MKRTLKPVLLLLVLILSIALSACGPSGTGAPISLDSIPEYSGEAFVKINGNIPFFTEDEITTTPFEEYAPLDLYGRCGVAFALVGLETMPTEERESITSVTPSGWVYDGVSNNKQYNGDWLYNRCHLIGFQLTAENDNEKNLITGTRYLNIEGMLPFENMIAAYVEETGNHVLYRVTPIFEGQEYVARGVLMEGYSVEDGGEEINFCVYAYNVQPGVEINYFTGTSRAADDDTTDLGPTDGDGEPSAPDGSTPTYILNKNSKKYHLPGKSCADSIKTENRVEYFGSREDFDTQFPGYDACGTCKPDEN